jgi:hypothetical protein
MKNPIFFICFLLIVNCTLNIERCMCQWEPDVRLTNDPALSQTSYNNAWCVAANGNLVHIVWYDYRDKMNYAEIYYKRSTDGGVTWGADTRLTNNDAWSGNPSVAVSGSNVNVVWQDSRDGNSEIYYKRSTDGGETWGVDTRLTNNSANSWQPCVAVFGSNVNVVWQDGREGNMEIYYKRSEDGGASWSSDIRMTNNPAVSSLPSVAVSGSFIHTVWYDERDGKREIYYKLSSDGGKNWGADTRLTNNTAASHYPSIAVSGSNVHVVYKYAGKDDIYYKLSTDNGINWGDEIGLTKSISYDYSSIAVSGLNVHVVWQVGNVGNSEIYYIRSGDGGKTWVDKTQLTNSTGISWLPSVAVFGSTVHVVWMDERDGNSEIYYKRNPTAE